MEKLGSILNELGISKVRLAKYLGVSRQMLYNYLALPSLADWPKEKVTKLLSLLDIKEESDLENLSIDSSYIMTVEGRLNDGVKDSGDREIIADLKGFNKKEQELLSDIINLLKEKLQEDQTKETYNAYLYLYHYLRSMETNPELKYILAYMSKSMGFTLYNNGGASKSKLAESHQRFVQDIEHKNEEKLSRTQELNTAKVQALRELGYNEINEENAKEVLEKIAEIQSRKV